MAKRKFAALASALKKQETLNKKSKSKSSSAPRSASPKSTNTKPVKPGSHATTTKPDTRPALNGHKKGHAGLIPFSQSDRILFVGEGNFSFAASCIDHHLEHGELVLATSLDTWEVVCEKYEDVKGNVESIEDCCGRVKHGVDATKLHTYFPAPAAGPLQSRTGGTGTANTAGPAAATGAADGNGSGGRAGGKSGNGGAARNYGGDGDGAGFDVVIFMFPHVAAGIADEARNIQTNQKMLLEFFRSVQHVLRPQGTVAVTLACNKTYDMWDLRGLAKSTGLAVKTSGPFDGSMFPGYTHARTQGYVKNDSGFSGGKGEERSARWTIFMRASEVVKPSKKSKTEDSDDDD